MSAEAPASATLSAKCRAAVGAPWCSGGAPTRRPAASCKARRIREEEELFGRAVPALNTSGPLRSPRLFAHRCAARAAAAVCCKLQQRRMRCCWRAQPQQRHWLAPSAPRQLRACASRVGRAPRAAGEREEAAPRVERPSFELSAEQAFAAQWTALKHNDTPHIDAGIEVLYAFADVDLFLPRSRYFGCSQDLGQFERFRRVLHTPQYRALLNHVELRVLSTLQVSEREVWQRVSVTAVRAGQQAQYCLALRQQLGGLRDGWWLGAGLTCDAAPAAAPADEDCSDDAQQEP